MAMRTHVQGHAIEDCGVVCAVVEVEATQEILISLAATGVLHGNHAGHGFEQFGGFEHRAQQEVSAADRTFAGRICLADKVGTTAENDDLFRSGAGLGTSN